VNIIETKYVGILIQVGILEKDKMKVTVILDLKRGRLKMDRTELFRVLLDAIRELSGFAPYAFEGAKEGMIRDKLRTVGEKLIEASNEA
jgi:hypothetical protein